MKTSNNEIKSLQRTDTSWIYDESSSLITLEDEPKKMKTKYKDSYKVDPLKASIYELFQPKLQKSVIERTPFFEEPLSKNANKSSKKDTDSSNITSDKELAQNTKIIYKNIDSSIHGLPLVQNCSEFYKNPITTNIICSSIMSKERIAMLTAKMKLKTPPPKPPSQLSSISQERTSQKPFQTDETISPCYVPNQPEVTQFDPFMLADLESIDSESTYSNDTAEDHNSSQLLTESQPRKANYKKRVSFSNELTIIPDYVFKEKDNNDDKKSNPLVKKKNSVQKTIASKVKTDIKTNSQIRDTNFTKQAKLSGSSPQRLSSKLLDFFQQKYTFTTGKLSQINKSKSSVQEKPELLTHLTKTRPRKPPSMRKSFKTTAASQ